MFKKYLIIFINSLLWFVNRILFTVNTFTDYIVRFWKNNIMRRLVLKFMAKVIWIFHYIRKYLEYVRDGMTFRILYRKTTLPLNAYYKQLKRR